LDDLQVDLLVAWMDCVKDELTAKKMAVSKALKKVGMKVVCLELQIVDLTVLMTVA
jgi:hypothetical protein